MSAVTTSTITGLGKAGLIKLAKRAANRKARVAAERFYNYAVSDGVLDATYLLRGDEGTYQEIWGGSDPLHGVLTHISDEPIVIQGMTFNGSRYRGVDEAGEWLYFFGSEDLTGGGEFLVGIFFDDFTEETLLHASLATRTDA